MSVDQTVRSYFEAIRARDVEAIRGLFASDAELCSAFGVVNGADAIATFYADYAFQFDDIWPEPGPLIIAGNRVAVEISLTMAGRTSQVADVFDLTGDKISRLAIYGAIERDQA
ncbi:MAG: nuclear transport factor 2 family protein [Acidimicrobiia bacterium]